MQKLSHPDWSEAFVYYKQLTSMVDFLNRNARFFGLFSGEVSSRVSFPLEALTLLQVLFTVNLMRRIGFLFTYQTVISTQFLSVN